MFFGVISARISSPTCIRRQRLRRQSPPHAWRRPVRRCACPVRGRSPVRRHWGHRFCPCLLRVMRHPPSAARRRRFTSSSIVSSRFVYTQMSAAIRARARRSRGLRARCNPAARAPRRVRTVRRSRSPPRRARADDIAGAGDHQRLARRRPQSAALRGAAAADPCASPSRAPPQPASGVPSAGRACLEPLEQREGVRGAAREPRHHPVLVQAPHLARVALHHRRCPSTPVRRRPPPRGRRAGRREWSYRRTWSCLPGHALAAGGRSYRMRPEGRRRIDVPLSEQSRSCGASRAASAAAESLGSVPPAVTVGLRHLRSGRPDPGNPRNGNDDGPYFLRALG